MLNSTLTKIPMCTVIMPDRRYEGVGSVAPDTGGGVRRVKISKWIDPATGAERDLVFDREDFDKLRLLVTRKKVRGGG